MPEIEIRPAVAPDILNMINLDHHYNSEFVWQMEVHFEEGKMNVGFRKTRLPHSVRVEYPRPAGVLANDWTKRDGLLVAIFNDEIIGYISMLLNMAPRTTWVSDLVVMRLMRRQGVGSALLLAAQEWGLQHATRRLLLEMQPKNFPATSLAQKLGFDFCGYHDAYYANHDLAMFFAKSLR